MLLISAVFCGGVAVSKGRSFFAWFLLGAILPVVSLLALIAVPNLNHERERKRLARANAAAERDTKVCPACAERIKKAAKFCRYCGADVSAA